jgi:hypothetical protein
LLETYRNLRCNAAKTQRLIKQNGILFSRLKSAAATNKALRTIVLKYAILKPELRPEFRLQLRPEPEPELEPQLKAQKNSHAVGLACVSRAPTATISPGNRTLSLGPFLLLTKSFGDLHD